MLEQSVTTDMLTKATGSSVIISVHVCCTSSSAIAERPRCRVR